MLLTASQILQITGATSIRQTLLPLEVTDFLLDSRRITFPETSLFFAIAGERHDGHYFIPQCYEQGVRQFVITHIQDITPYPEANFFKVKDVVRALQDLATHHRQAFNIPIIGITGSNGKTVIKEWLFQLLNQEFHIARSPRSYNSQTGVPLSVCQLEAHHSLGIFEAGISRAGEMKHLAPVISCSIGIFTNIGSAHQEGFHSIQQKADEKSLLFQQTESIIYCIDYHEIAQSLQKLKHAHFFTWSRKKDADLRITDVSSSGKEGTIINGIYKKKQYSIEIPFADEASIENAIHCWCTMILLNYTHPVIALRMRFLRGVAMRMEQKAGINNCTIINDSYNADLNSLNIALEFLIHQTHQHQKVLILSDLLQSGLNQKNLYKKVSALILQKKINRLIGIGENIPVIAAYLPDNFPTAFFPDTSSFLQSHNSSDFKDAAILIKGARIFEMELIAQALTLQNHNTILEINLDALAHNLKLFKQSLQPSTKVMAMVKAAAYGSGITEVAKLLEFHRIDYLGVAYTDEGIKLREAGIKTPILVLNPEESDGDIFRKYELEPEIYSLEMLEKWCNDATSRQTLTSMQLMLDTGMHRLGFMESDIPRVLVLLKNNPYCQITGIFTHLASSANPVDDDFTRAQISLFHKMYEQIATVLGYRPMRHILNSSGIVRFPESQLEMVRLGLGLYGKDSTDTLGKNLATVMELKARVSQVRWVESGDTVGYNRRGKISKPTLVGTITAGYADGIPRKAGNGNFSVLIRNKRAPIIGDVCMDMCMIDLTGIEETKAGEEVVVFGELPNVVELARAAETIPYEIFTNISERVKRVYIQE